MKRCAPNVISVLLLLAAHSAVSRTVAQAQLPITVLAPRPNQDGNLVAKTFPLSSQFVGGMMVTSSYPGESGSGEYSTSFIVIKKFDARDKVSSLQIPFKHEAGKWIFDVQISPDRQKVLFKYGDPLHGSPQFRFYLYDLKQHQLKAGSPALLQSRLMAFSPDSRKIAYINDSVYPHVLALWDIATDHSTTITKRLENFDFDGAGRLVYSRYFDRTGTTPGLNIYSYSFKDQKETLLARNADEPHPSPDGKWLLHWGLVRKGEFADDRESSLYLLNLETKARFPIEPPSYLSTWRWAPNSHKLVCLAPRQLEPGTTDIYTTDPLSRKFKLVTSVTVKSKPENLVTPSRIFPLGFSENSQYFYLDLDEKVSREVWLPIGNLTTLQSINLTTGAKENAIQLKDTSGFYWLPRP